MIPLCVPNVGEAERELLMRCIDDGYVSSVGPFVGELESAVAAVTGARGAVATGSGTQALRLALHVVGVQPGDLVVMPAFTFIATANAVWQAGARPWLLDVDAESWTLDPERLRAFVRYNCRSGAKGPTHEATGARVGAIMPVYTMGRVARMSEIGAIAREAGVPVVADAAAALGSTSVEGQLAALADLSCVSFNGNKIATAGCGGAIFGMDDAMLARARSLASTARVGTDYDHVEPAFNYRMSNMDAAVGLAQVRRLPEFVAAKRRIRDAYDRALANHPAALAWTEPAWTESNRWFSGLLTRASGSVVAKAMIASLNANGIGARPFWKPVHLQPMYSKAPRGPLPVTDELWGRIVTLPCSSGLTDADLQFCVNAISRLSDVRERVVFRS